MNKWLLIIPGSIVLISIVLYVQTSQRTDSSVSQQTVPVQSVVSASRYVPYAKDSFDSVKDKKRVLYFFAPWCSTCRPLDKELTENMEQIPEEVIIFKTSYDSETTLKDVYNVTYQHTFVQVDEQGTEVTKWSGGGIADIVANVR